MPNWKKVITSGSNGELNTLKLSGVVNANTDTDKFLVLDGSGNVDFRTGANVLSDIGGASSSTLTSVSSSFSTRITTLESEVGGILNTNQTYVDFKGQQMGGMPWATATDLQPVDQWFGVWIAPTSGYIDAVYVSPENSNTPSDDFSITYYTNGNPGPQVQQTMGAAGTNVKFTMGSSYSFSANDRISLWLDKFNNTADLYAVQVVFRLAN